jgi:hypothetical protein
MGEGAQVSHICRFPMAFGRESERTKIRIVIARPAWLQNDIGFLRSRADIEAARVYGG